MSTFSIFIRNGRRSVCSEIAYCLYVVVLFFLSYAVLLKWQLVMHSEEAVLPNVLLLHVEGIRSEGVTLMMYCRKRHEN